MDQELAAQLAALVGALGSVLVLLARQRVVFLAGVVLLGAAGVGLAGSLVGESVVDRATSPVPIAAAAFGALLLVAAAIPLLRYPGAIIPLVAASAPFRPPIDFGGENRFVVAIATDGQIGRLLPLYAVLAAATLAIAIRVLRSGEVAPLPRELAYPAAFFVGLAGLSLLWSNDVHEGADTLLFFLYPSVLMVAVVARSPVRAWLPRALFILTVGLAIAVRARRLLGGVRREADLLHAAGGDRERVRGLLPRDLALQRPEPLRPPRRRRDRRRARRHVGGPDPLGARRGARGGCSGWASSSRTRSRAWSRSSPPPSPSSSSWATGWRAGSWSSPRC